MDDYNIQEVLEFVNDYLEEKSKLLDKVYGKDTKKLLDAENVTDVAMKSGLPQSFIDKKHENQLNARKALVDKVNSNLSKRDSAYTHYDNRSTNDIVNSLKTRRRGDHENVDVQSIRALKNDLGAGKHNIPSKKEPGKYLKVQQAIDKATGVKRESTETKLAIYEACDAGFITDEEKSKLLSLLED